MKHNKLQNMVFIALFIAIILILSYTPLGFVNLGIISGTIVHIPVIIGALLLGPVSGAFLGFVFGLISLVKTLQGADASVLAFVFNPYYSGNVIASLVILFIPRILVGVVPCYIVKLFNKIKVKNSFITYSVASFLGSMTNTLLVMNFIYLFFGSTHATVIESGFGANLIDGIGMGLYGIILSVVIVVGIPEAILAVVLSSSICKAFDTAGISSKVKQKN